MGNTTTTLHSNKGNPNVDIPTTCQRCLFPYTVAKMGAVQCEYCDLHDALDGQYNDTNEFWAVVQKIKRQRGEYNCLIGISGGLDSSVLLYAAKYYWGLNPLVIHFDNGWNTKAAKRNMLRLTNALGVNSITYKVDNNEYLKCCQAFLSFGLADADIPNDLVMTKFMYDTAEKYGIKYILNGHDFRTEGSTPKPWTYMDGRYMNDVYRQYTGKSLRHVPVFTFWDQIRCALKGIVQVRPFYYRYIHDSRTVLEEGLKSLIEWSDYGPKHAENVYTHFVGAWLLPKKFNIDKRMVYLSARIRSGAITRDDAIAELGKCSDFDIGQIGHMADYISSSLGKRNDFKRYDFKKYRYVVWLMYKLGVVPRTFYYKYAT